MTKLIAMIRHGEYHQQADTPSAWQPFPLTNEGEQEVQRQALEFAKLLQKHRWQLHHQVHSSPLLRAWQTAQIYIKTLNTFFAQPPEHLEFPELSERSVGNVANLTISQIEQLLKQDPRYDAPPIGWKSKSEYKLPFMGAESLLEAGERVARHLTEIVNKNGDAQCEQTQPQDSANDNCVRLVIGHGAAIRHAACHLKLMTLNDVSQFSMYHAHPIVLSYKGAKWQHIAGQWKPRKSGEQAKD